MISIIIPIYNVEDYLSSCLDSIKIQTYSDFEVLMVNDGSKDSSRDIAESFLSDCRFRLFNQINKGQGAARNIGLDNAKGDYICFVDSDDSIDPQFLEKLLQALTENNADIASCSVFRVWANGQKRLYDFTGTEDQVYTDIGAYLKTGSFVMWNKIYRRNLFDGLRFPEGIKFEDFALAPQIYSRAKKIVSIKDALYNYLWRNDSTTTKQLVQPDILRAQRVLEISEFGKTNSDILEIYFIRQVVGSLLWSMCMVNRPNSEIAPIVQSCLEKYPEISYKIRREFIGKHKSLFGRLLLKKNYRSAKIYSITYDKTYRLLRKVYELLKG